jgi:hypothetical protein
MLSARSDKLRAVAAIATPPMATTNPIARRSRIDGLRAAFGALDLAGFFSVF